MAGVEIEYLPVPQRYKGNGFTVRAPSFTLPKEITNIEQARQFIAANVLMKFRQTGACVPQPHEFHIFKWVDYNG